MGSLAGGNEVTPPEKEMGPGQSGPPRDKSCGIQTEEGLTRTTSSAAEQPEDVPDGGLVAWSQVVSGHIANAMSWGYGSGYAAFQLYYKENMDLPASQISWVGSVQFFLYFGLCMVSGRLADAGYTRSLYLTGSVLVALGMFMTSLSTQYWQILLAQGFCNGIGGGLMFLPAISNVGSYFKKNRTLAMSIQACGSSTGAILFPALFQYLEPKVGFGWAVRVCAFAAVFFCSIGFALLRPRKLKRKAARIIDLQAFKNAPFVLYMVGSFFVYFSLFTMLIYVSILVLVDGNYVSWVIPDPFGCCLTYLQINSYAREVIGLSEIESINFVLITNAVAIVARPIFGFIADRYTGPINTFAFNALGLAVLAFGWAGVWTRSDMYAYSIVMGFMNGACQGVFPGAASSLVKDPTKLGTWLGMLFAVAGVGTLAGPPVMGAIIDNSGGQYLWAQIWAGLMIVLGSVPVAFASWLVGGKTKNTLWAKA
jgi:MFS transporter, MCT family, solute carrier family 16 (monocarboxylic acid transporters), member 3